MNTTKVTALVVAIMFVPLAYLGAELKSARADMAHTQLALASTNEWAAKEVVVRASKKDETVRLATQRMLADGLTYTEVFQILGL